MSGFFYSRQASATVPSFTVRAFQRVLIPFYGFGLLNIIYFAITAPVTMDKLTEQVWQLFVMGNLDIAGQLWFLTALFCTQIVHHVVSRVVRLPIIALALALISYLIIRALPSPPTITYNLLAIPYYWVFLACGDVFFRWYQNKDLRHVEPWAFCLCGVFAVLIFTQDRYFFTFWGLTVPENWSFRIGWDLLMFVGLSTATIGVAKACAGSGLIRDIGQNTLILVGVETLIKSIALAIMGMISHMVRIEGPVHVIIYSASMILFARLIFFRVINTGAPWMVGKARTR